ncbi:L-ectoine synthase [Barrientosiimonas humi]|uniref:L-ectoine synthase n=2 Tax=Barrientosiimonas TaxID=1535207 RepID=A0A542XGJ4_9MICO|nr:MULTISPECIES: ectoine synthase [Barrientosiimonas]TQL34956.1 L-ectoine synthase [Barrientosiimonas humi]BDZ60116.1 L-ectoine synthase [Barrientosiimonas endolithica]CAG7571144.1 L-ectoine synthase [Barrientosiimonas humi]
MKVIHLDELNDTDRDVDHGNWRSRRFVLASDKVGFSFHDTLLRAGTETEMWYANHVEAVYVYEGTGTLVNRDTGEEFALRPGTMYLLNDHDKHTVRADTDIRTACVFNPPVTGREVHDEDGVYPLLQEA